jgi:hypothetical protein
MRRGNVAIRTLRTSMLIGYAGITVASLSAAWAPRVFWTMIMPAVPLVLVLLGFHGWREVCPIARVGELGARREARRRMPRWWSRASLSLPLTLLALTLLARLIALNGDPLLLALLLAILPLCAIAVNAIYGGRSWCHYVCPVGPVERLYTDGVAREPNADPGCAQCTGCKSVCPDIDQARAYSADLDTRDRLIAGYAWPGLVLSFYGYYWLRAGDWAAFFDGAWTLQPVGRELILGAGWFFAPALPALPAAALTLALGAALSLACFYGVERLWIALGGEPRRTRHRVLVIAGFSAFNLFYLFAGQPSLRQVPWLAPLVALLAHAASTRVLMHRWQVPLHMTRKRGALPVIA